MNTSKSLAFKRFAAVTLFGLVSVPSIGRVEAQNENRQNVLFIQMDRAIEFNLEPGPPPGGNGIEVGTVRGRIEGTSTTNFRFVGLDLDNRVGIADNDGDRIIFHKVGTGIPLPPLDDPSADPDFQVFGLTGSAFILSGTYEVVATTGKYVERFPLGQKFPFRSIATNPTWPPATPPAPGTIVPGTEYVVVYSNKVE